MAMEPTSWFLMDSEVVIHRESQPIPDAAATRRWKEVSFASRKAYGGGDAESFLDGLALFASVEPPPCLSALRLQLKDAVVDAATLLIAPVCPNSLIDSDLISSDNGLAVISVTVGLWEDERSRCYLVWDTAASSLTVIHGLDLFFPDFAWLHPSWSMKPVPVKLGDGSDSALVIVARYCEVDERQLPRNMGYLVCLWPLSPSLSPSCISTCISRQSSKVPIFPELPNLTLTAQQVFSFQGKCFWVDLFQGVLYCKLDDLLDKDSQHLQFHFISLPPEYEPNYDVEYCGPPLNMYRTMASIGDSIMLVVCDEYKVTLWKLMPDLLRWENEGDIQIGDLLSEHNKLGVDSYWEMTYPVLSSTGAEDPGVLYLKISYYHIEQPYPNFMHRQYSEECLMLCINTRDKSLMSCHQFSSLDESHDMSAPTGFCMFNDSLGGPHLKRKFPALE